MGFKKQKFCDFSIFDIWWVIGGRGYHIKKYLKVSAFVERSSNIPQLWKKIIIAEKVPIFGQNFQLQSDLIPEFATRWEVSHIWACSARWVLSEYTTHTTGSFLEFDPPWTKFQSVYYIYTMCVCYLLTRLRKVIFKDKIIEVMFLFTKSRLWYPQNTKLVIIVYYFF